MYIIIYFFNFDYLNFEFCILNMYSFERLQILNKDIIYI